MKRRPSKKQRWAPGDIVAIPLSDGSRGLVQVLGLPEMGGFVPIAFLDVRVPSNQERTEHQPIQAGPVAVASAERLCLDTGEWIVVGHAPIQLKPSRWPNAKQRRSDRWTGARFHSSLLVEDFLNAYWGLAPWNAMKDPDYFMQFLLDQTSRPPLAYLIQKN